MYFKVLRKFFDKPSHHLSLLLVSGLFLRLIFAFLGTYELDFNTFLSWSQSLSEVGFTGFYSKVWSDYLPGYLYVLKFLFTAQEATGLPVKVLYKLPAILGDLALVFLIYQIVRRDLGEKKALLAAAFFCFNPAVFANSTFWGQVDIFSALLPVAAIFFMQNTLVSSFLLAYAGVVKPQAAMALPVLLALMLSGKWKFKKILLYFGMTALFFLSFFLPFSNEPSLIVFILKRVAVTLGQYPYSSVNAFNFWGLWGFWQSDSGGILSAKNLGSLILLSMCVVAFFKVYCNRKLKYQALAFLFLANFMFMTRMHERHLLPMLAPLAVAAAHTSYLWRIYAFFSVTYTINLLYAYQYVGVGNILIPEIAIKTIIVLNLILFVLFFLEFVKGRKVYLENLLKKFSKKQSPSFMRDLISDRYGKKVLILLLIFSAVSRIILLGHPNEYYFDEIYHQFTARQMLQGSEKPWHWSNPNPEGFAYEWTHPPLGKEIMAVSMFVFGENHWAARLPGALMGVGVIYLTYLIARHLTKRNDIAILSSLILSTDGLVFTMSRIATVDIYMVFFALSSLYFFLRQRYAFASVGLGLALASKWSALLFVPILLVAFVSQKLKYKKTLLTFLFVPAAVYIISYLPMFHFGYDFKDFWGMQKQMWWYHSGLEASHPYASGWISWILNLRPVYFYKFISEDKSLVGNIYSMGNPLFFWTGLASVFFSLYLTFKNKAPKEIGLLVFSYFAVFVPWAASPRVMFIYHYMPALPFLAIILAFILRKVPKVIVPFSVGIVLIFLYFYPHWTAISVPRWLYSSYFWIDGWR